MGEVGLPVLLPLLLLGAMVVIIIDRDMPEPEGLRDTVELDRPGVDDALRLPLRLLDSTTAKDFCRWRLFQCRQFDSELNQSVAWSSLHTCRKKRISRTIEIENVQTYGREWVFRCCHLDMVSLYI